MDIWTKRGNAHVICPSSLLALCHFTICFLSHSQGRNYVFSILTLNHYLHELVLKFHLHIKVSGVVTSKLKCYLTVVFFHIYPNEILPPDWEDSKQSRLKFYASVEMSALMHWSRHSDVSQDNCGKAPPCAKAGYPLPPLPTEAGLGR